MASWNELLDKLLAFSGDDAAAAQWLNETLDKSLVRIGSLRDGRNVLVYGSAFLQKPLAPAQLIQITGEDLNGFMSVIYGLDWSKGLSLILHTPGGITNAAETLVAYLRSKFDYLEIIVPTFAMSAGTMIALSADRIVMGRQSQLGPIDPQMQIPTTGRFVSARAIVDQFEYAKNEIIDNVVAAHAWAPVLQSHGPALLQEARNALAFGERLVAGWLARYMFRGGPDPQGKAQEVAAHFNAAEKHLSHGRRIDRDEARSVGVIVEDLEDNQELQDVVLTVYHLTTLMFERSQASKVVRSSASRAWIKNWVETPGAQKVQAATKPAEAPVPPAQRAREIRKKQKGKKKR